MAGSSHVLARKYRPQIFADLIGQDVLVRTMTNAIAANRLAHAYMLTGIRGVGKTSSARIIAKGLNCIGPDGQGGMTPNPCGKCRHCIDIANDAHIDVIEIDAASNTGVDNVREIIAGAKYNPVSARFKIYIIDEVHMLSKQAFNALLKTLEEPPERIKFIFATTEIRKVPITILSRCQRFDLRRVDEAALAKHMAAIAEKEHVQAEPEALALLARAGDGSVRDCLSLMDQAMTQADGVITAGAVRTMLGLADRTVVFDLFEHIMKGEAERALSLVEGQYACGADPFEIVQDLMALTHWLTRIKIVPKTADDPMVPEPERVRGKALAEQVSMGALTGMWQMLMKGNGEVRNADAPMRALEMLIIRMTYLADMPSPQQIIADIKKNGLTRPVQPEPQGEVVSAVAAQPRRVAVPKVESESAVSADHKTAGEAVSVGPASLADIVALAKEQGERILAFQVENYVRPVAVTPGLVTCVILPEADRDICQKMMRLLSQKTGMNWIVRTQAKGGGQTLKEIKEAEQNALTDQIRKTPIVRAVTEAFTGARIEKIRPATPETFNDGGGDNTDVEE